MCASWSGKRAAVGLLLQNGAAWVGVVDTQGRDAKDLALEGITMHLLTSLKSVLCVCLYNEVELIHICFSPAGHNELLEELESYGTSAERDPQSDSRLAHTERCGSSRAVTPHERT